MGQRTDGGKSKSIRTAKYYSGNCVEVLGRGPRQKPFVWCNISVGSLSNAVFSITSRTRKEKLNLFAQNAQRRGDLLNLQRNQLPTAKYTVSTHPATTFQTFVEEMLSKGHQNAVTGKWTTT